MIMVSGRQQSSCCFFTPCWPKYLNWLSLGLSKQIEKWISAGIPVASLSLLSSKTPWRNYQQNKSNTLNWSYCRHSDTAWLEKSREATLQPRTLHLLLQRPWTVLELARLAAETMMINTKTCPMCHLATLCLSLVWTKFDLFIHSLKHTPSQCIVWTLYHVKYVESGLHLTFLYWSDPSLLKA